MVQAGATPVTRQRPNTYERWKKALRRAIDNGLEIFTVNDTGERFVISASKLDTLYRTDARISSCASGVAGDPVCQHRAVVRFTLGWQRLPEPAPAQCIWCNGTGRIPNDYHERYDVCDMCGSTGTRSAAIVIPTPGNSLAASSPFHIFPVLASSPAPLPTLNRRSPR
jgi:hypothetical protein